MMTKTEVLLVDTQRPAPEIIERTRATLQAGHLVVVPTETRYGLMVRADDQAVLEKLYRVKGRPLTTPTAIFVRRPDDISEHGRVNPKATRLAEAFLPGPLTLVMKAVTDWAPPRTVDGKVGLRCSPLPLLDAILASVSFPTTATSANRSGHTEPTRIEEIEKEFADEVSLYLDAGVLDGVASTVVDCSGEEVTVLREGAISAVRIMEVAEQ